MSIIMETDGYKWSHHLQYPEDTERVYSYMEARTGAAHEETVFFGLQYLLNEYFTRQVSKWDVDAAENLAKAYFGRDDVFNRAGWDHIVNDHQGFLPLRIKAVPEGTPVPVGNVLMTMENTCDQCCWVTNLVESLLMHVWGPTTVATVSRGVKQMLARFLDETAESRDALPFQLHDFGYRGVSSSESAAHLGAGHLINFLGTDTIPAIDLLACSYGEPEREWYRRYEGVAATVVATEHSVMTALGPEGELQVVRSLLERFPTGILSVVADSYDIYQFTDLYVGSVLRNQIKDRDGVFVVRPDSTTPDHTTPAALVVRLLESLWTSFRGEENSKGYKVLDPHVRVLWGDGLTPRDILEICQASKDAGFSTENLVFGMGGGLLQRVNRDTERFAVKASAIRINGEWHDVSKDPLDESKRSKRGRLALVEYEGKLTTVSDGAAHDVLQTVYEDGNIKVHQTLAEIRDRAAIEDSVTA